MKKEPFDPLAYIESAFLDTKRAEDALDERVELSLEVPTIGSYLNGREGLTNGKGSNIEPHVPARERRTAKKRFKRTTMSAPRPRRTAEERERPPDIDSELREVWEMLPHNVEFLCSYFDDAVTANYYRGDFKESRRELVRRLLDPELSLEETARLLGVCPATVRRYTNRGWLNHHRTTGGQRRFRLSHLVQFVDEHGRFPEE